MTVWAAAASAMIAGVALFFNGYQTWQARRTATLQVLTEFFKNATEREHELLHAADETARNRAFVELLNFLELYAAAHNKRLAVGVAREIIQDKLFDSIVVIKCMPACHGMIERAVTSEATFKHLWKLMTGYRQEIDGRCNAYRSLLAQRAAP